MSSSLEDFTQINYEIVKILQANGHDVELKVTTIYNPAITPELLHQAHEPLNHPWFAPGELPIILSVGRVTLNDSYILNFNEVLLNEILVFKFAY